MTVTSDSGSARSSAALPRRRADARGHVLARLAQRIGLRLAAALRHGLGEVGEQHGEPQPQRRPARMNPEGAPRRRPRERAATSTVAKETAGLDHETSPGCGSSWRRGSSFFRSIDGGGAQDVRLEQRALLALWTLLLRASRKAGTVVGLRRRCGWPWARARPFRLRAGSVHWDHQLQVLDDGAERERREEGECADEHDDADEQPDEQRPYGWGRCPRPPGHELLPDEGAGEREHRDESSRSGRSEHHQAEERVVEGRVGVEAGERAAVVVARRVRTRRGSPSSRAAPG